MRMLIVSHTPHYLRDDKIVGWGATVREIDQLANVFSEVVHLAPLHRGTAPESAFAYSSPRIRVEPIPAAGGETILAKFSILAHAPTYIRALLRQFREADVVHIRCPANISMIAIVLLALVRSPRRRWIKYAGNWQPRGREAWSYTFQRWWLNKGWHRGVVTVNGQWPGQPEFVLAFLNPCLTERELEEGHDLLATKRMATPARLIFVGRLDEGKGVRRILQVMARLQEMGCAASLDLIGDGRERPEFERMADSLGVGQHIEFHGWKPRTALASLYARAHFMLLPSSSSEGWPKVLSEAMAYGVVPLASNVSSIPQYLSRFGVGRSLDAEDTDGFAEAVVWYAEHPDEWKKESENGVRAAGQFSYANYLKAVRDILDVPRPCRATH